MGAEVNGWAGEMLDFGLISELRRMISFSDISAGPKNDFTITRESSLQAEALELMAAEQNTYRHMLVSGAAGDLIAGNRDFIVWSVTRQKLSHPYIPAKP